MEPLLKRKLRLLEQTQFYPLTSGLKTSCSAFRDQRQKLVTVYIILYLFENFQDGQLSLYLQVPEI